MSRIGILESSRRGDLMSASRQEGFHWIRIGRSSWEIIREVRDYEDALANTRDARVPQRELIWHAANSCDVVSRSRTMSLVILISLGSNEASTSGNSGPPRKSIWILNCY